jgi:hypothetical protein
MVYGGFLFIYIILTVVFGARSLKISVTLIFSGELVKDELQNTSQTAFAASARNA